jgi:hypothetical protein
VTGQAHRCLPAPDAVGIAPEVAMPRGPVGCGALLSLSGLQATRRSTVLSFQQPSSRTTTSQESWARYTHMYGFASAGEVDNRPLVLLSRRSMLVKRP